MKLFNVMLPIPIIEGCREIAERQVVADYYRVVDGALIFRTEKRGHEPYNPAVRTFAPGFWAEVYEARG